MTTGSGPAGVLLRSWRERRRYSQQALASETGVSTRHLSCVETGKAKASRELLLLLAEALELPLRDRNELLLAAGLAPAFPARELSDPSMHSVNAAVQRILAAHQPFPALVMDRHWNLVDANPAATMFLDGVAPELLGPPVNVVRVSVHPDGLAPRVVNFAEYAGHLLGRLRHQVETTGDPELAALELEARQYAVADPSVLPPFDVVLPLVLEASIGTLSLFSTIATFGTPLDVTVSELAIESFYPADADSERLLRASGEPPTR
jgi:transcriptional regulator with XRE-family HTH domain